MDSPEKRLKQQIASRPHAFETGQRSRTSSSTPIDHLDSDVDDTFMKPPRRRPMKPLQPSQNLKSGTFTTSEGWTLEGVLAKGKRFCRIPRISANSPDVYREIERHESEGRPVIIEGWHKHDDWPNQLFSMQFLKKNHGEDTLRVRNIHDRKDKSISLSQYLQECEAKPPCIVPNETERWYGKDADCPPQWREWLCNGGVLPSSLLPSGSNDILQNLPATEQVESLMCYLGIGDTFTPCHKDLCASSGQNLMCHSVDGGSSFWFMTASSDAPLASDYFQNNLGQELDWETHAASVDQLAEAPFDVYVAEQKVGDLVLVPPRSCHQVVNTGGLTVKMSWSRMTVKGLETALQYELPIYQRVCRPELYRVKTILYRTLLRYTAETEATLDRIQAHTSLVNYAESSSEASSTRSLSPDDVTPEHGSTDHTNDIATLLSLFDDVLVEEHCQNHEVLDHIISSGIGWAAKPMSDTCVTLQPPPRLSDLERETPNLACDSCGADVFQSFFACSKCGKADAEAIGDRLVICPACYVDGRSCKCEVMTPIQYRPFSSLLNSRNKAAKVLYQLKAANGGGKARFKGLNEEDLIAMDHVRIFEAACILCKSRRTMPSAKDRTCRTGSRTGSSHAVPRNNAVSCDLCHGSKCFEHILYGGVHAAEAILAAARGKPHTAWHHLHQESLREFPKRHAELMEAERRGDRTSHRDRLVSIAQRYGWWIQPTNLSVRSGWYDESLEEPAPAVVQARVSLSPGSSSQLKEQNRVEEMVFGRGNSPLTEDSDDPLAPTPKPPLKTYGRTNKRPREEVPTPRSAPPPPKPVTETPRKVLPSLPLRRKAIVQLSPRDWEHMKREYHPIETPPESNIEESADVRVPQESPPKASSSKILTMKRRIPDSGDEDASDDEKDLRQDYSGNLADVLNHSNSANARYTVHGIRQTHQPTVAMSAATPLRSKADSRKRPATQRSNVEPQPVKKRRTGQISKPLYIPLGTQQSSESEHDGDIVKVVEDSDDSSVIEISAPFPSHLLPKQKNPTPTVDKPYRTPQHMIPTEVEEIAPGTDVRIGPPKQAARARARARTDIEISRSADVPIGPPKNTGRTRAGARAALDKGKDVEKPVIAVHEAEARALPVSVKMKKRAVATKVAEPAVILPARTTLAGVQRSESRDDIADDASGPSRSRTRALRKRKAVNYSEIPEQGPSAVTLPDLHPAQVIPSKRDQVAKPPSTNSFQRVEPTEETREEIRRISLDSDPNVMQTIQSELTAMREAHSKDQERYEERFRQIEQRSNQLAEENIKLRRELDDLRQQYKQLDLSSQELAQKCQTWELTFQSRDFARKDEIGALIAKELSDQRYPTDPAFVRSSFPNGSGPEGNAVMYSRSYPANRENLPYGQRNDVRGFSRPWRSSRIRGGLSHHNSWPRHETEGPMPFEQHSIQSSTPSTFTDMWQRPPQQGESSSPHANYDARAHTHQYEPHRARGRAARTRWDQRPVEHPPAQLRSPGQYLPGQPYAISSRRGNESDGVNFYLRPVTSARISDARHEDQRRPGSRTNPVHDRSPPEPIPPRAPTPPSQPGSSRHVSSSSPSPTRSRSRSVSRSRTRTRNTRSISNERHYHVSLSLSPSHADQTDSPESQAVESTHTHESFERTPDTVINPQSPPYEKA